MAVKGTIKPDHVNTNKYDLRVPGMVSLKLGDLSTKAWADYRKQNKHASKGEAEYEPAAERAAESKPQ